MSKLICLEIPKGEKGYYIHIKLRTPDNKLQDILARDILTCEFENHLEMDKFITFESIAFVKSIEPPNDEHGVIITIDDSGWVANVGFKVDLIESYHYI